MPNLNSVHLMGNLTRDPEITYTPKGTAIAKFGIAINRTWTSEAGEKREEVTFIDLEAFARTAEVLGEYIHKGDPIFIEGRLKLDQWDDKQSGQKRSKLKVVVEGFQFIKSKSDRDEYDQEPRSSQKPASQRSAPKPPPRPPADPDLDAQPDDIPF